MITWLKSALKRRWPPLRLRTILFGTLLFTAALPGAGALFLRVYENTLVRQTEAELVAQGAALTAAAQTLWPTADRNSTADPGGLPVYSPEASTIDLRSTPILNERPSATGATGPPVADATAAAAELAPILQATQRITLASIQLIDRNGVVVLGHEAGGSYSRLPEVSAALGGRNGTVLRRNGSYSRRYAFEWLSRASSLRIHHARPIIVGGQTVAVLLLSRSPRALFRGLYEDRGKIILGIVLIFLTLLVLTGLLSRGIARPIELLARATRGVAAGTGTVPDTPVTAAVEIRDLFGNFRNMTASIERRSHYLRDFAASVSHEFKTPLAGIVGTIELFEDHADRMTNVERDRFLGNMRADADRLAQLVTRLLDLARADMALPVPDAEVEALAVVRQVADAFNTPDLDVSIAPSPRRTLVATPASTIEAVLGTLLTNARQAGADRITIGLVQREAVLEIAVTDNGSGVPPSDVDRIFEPFFTTRRESGGTGLGLAIAASLLRASNGGEVTMRESGGAGTCFVVSLPTAQEGTRNNTAE